MIPERLLVTDLDGTFIGDRTETMRLWSDLERTGIGVVFASGRHLPSIEDFYAEYRTDRRADACICMVGTEIWRRVSDGYSKDREWTEEIDVHWDRGAIDDVVSQVPGTVPQPPEWQSDLKSSWYLEKDAPGHIRQIREQLAELGVQAKLVYSEDRFLDVIPHRAGKGGAVRFLAESLGLRPAQVVTAGDTGNDLDMMQPSLGYRSIAVGNSTDELRRYRSPKVYHATATHARGIREGLVHFGWLENHESFA